jgi:2-polyprenyl-3-methyl-5-hydroxy-6-metoxy-1,4-benzoquinol methylase
MKVSVIGIAGAEKINMFTSDDGRADTARINDIRCSVCRATIEEYREVYDDRYGYPGAFRLVRCPGCVHTELRAHFGPGDIKKLYTDYYPRSSFNVEHFAPAGDGKGFSAWLNGEKRSAYLWVPPNVRVLDIGCGFGESLAYHKARGCDVYGVEADENIRRVAEKYGFNVHVGLFNPGIYEPGFFDYVTMDQVIEHIADPLETLRGVAQILKKSGIAVISTPNSLGWGARMFGRYWINWHAPYHRQFFSPKSMSVAAEQAGLAVDSVRTITSSEWLFYQWIHLLTCPPAGTPSPFWSPRGTRSLRVKLLFAGLLAVHYTKINHVITRLFDAFGFGDNYLFILRKP